MMGVLGEKTGMKNPSIYDIGCAVCFSIGVVCGWHFGFSWFGL
jgi:hypothetical protein|tara:strand:+ start:194 stop:322 length:129 start_codon:yes stop_codon:yes gene_type:complete